MSLGCADSRGCLHGGPAGRYGSLLRLLGVLLLPLWLLAACSEEGPTPEEQVVQAIESLETALEAGSLSDASDWIGNAYRDRYHPDKRAAVRTLFGYLQRHKNLHLFSRIQEVEVFSGDTQATAVVQVAMTARPVEAPEILLQLQADLYRFEVQLAWDQDEEAWRIIGSSWRRANLAALGG
jgi:hypothetical protein